MTQLIQARHQSADEDEEARVAAVLHWLSLMAIAFLVGIGLKSWFAGHTTHGTVLWVFAGLVSLNRLSYRQTRNHQLNKTGLITIVGMLFAYLIASGGESNTGPLWFYVFPPLLFYLTDPRTGTALMMYLMLFAMLVFQFPDLPFVTTTYGLDFKIRFFATILFESIFCFVLESSRRKARLALVNLAIMHEQAARTDELTGLANRREMHHHLTLELSRYQRSGHHFSVILIDLDLFKRINDTFSHDAGDTVLRQFAQLMQTMVRQSDACARWGGEEFLVLLPDTSLLQALTLAERLRDEVAGTPFSFRDQSLPVTISAGVCSITQARSIEQLLKLADEHLYEAKANGRNRIAPRVRSKRSATGDSKSLGTA